MNAEAVPQGRDWQALVPPERLLAWMDEAGLGRGPLEEVEPLTGGTQNVLLRFRRDGRSYVLRRPPLHPNQDGNATIGREARVLAALAGTDVPHPGFIAACADPDVLGAAFYLMEPVEGFNPTVGLPALHAGSVSVRRAMGEAIIDALATLSRVDHRAVGLGDFGRADGWLERQVPRWRALLDSYRRYDGWLGPAGIPGVEEVARWLEARRPGACAPGILHGDYHLSNVLYRPDGPEVAAIVDWELVSIGPPLLDLGWLLATWPDPNGQGPLPMIRVEPWLGWPEPRHLVRRYAEATGREPEDLAWYAVLACFRLGIILEGTQARAAAGRADPTTGDLLHRATIGLFERALGWMESREPWG